MDILVKKIRLNELEDFVNSSDYTELEDKPISLLRVKSYINNPNSNDTDVVLFMAFLNDNFVGYKTILPDTLKLGTQNIRFGWLSGTWTCEKHRRKGISSLLLNEVFKDWDDMLMFTGYAKASKAVYDKSEKFALLKSFTGYRYYLRFSFGELLPTKSNIFKSNVKILILMDNLLNSIFDLRFNFLNFNNNNLYNIEKIENWNDNLIKFLKPYKINELFKRDAGVYNWIFEYPWIRTDEETKKEAKKYFFSSYSNRFKSIIYKIYNNESKKVVGVFIVNIKNEKLHVPYIYADSDLTSILKDFILNICIQFKISYITIYNEKLCAEFNKQNLFKIKQKKFTQNYFATKKILKNYPEIRNLKIQNGDGDIVFI